MGNGSSQKARHSTDAAQKRDRRISEELQKQWRAERRVQKLLLLGTAECGKSTILKQMQILHMNGFSEVEIEIKRHVICNSAIHGMVEILKAMEHFEIPLDSPATQIQSEAKHILSSVGGKSITCLTSPIYLSLKSLWMDDDVSKCYERKAEFNFSNTTQYFLDSLDRIYEANYRPTNQDILYSRVATTGIVENTFDYKQWKICVIDVGGQRSERKKWIHQFDNVNAVIFISAISEFDEVLKEDDKTNRLMESMNLFDRIANSQWFVKSSIILFLNKKDLLTEKLKAVPFSPFSGDYDGDGQSYEECVKWLSEKFQRLNRAKNRKMYIYETCATDTEQVQKVIDSVIDTVMAKNAVHVAMV